MGKIKTLSSRGGYVTFEMVDDNGVNQCQSCLVDPGGRSNNRCWVKETEEVKISLLLSAQARDKKITGRVVNLTNSCEIYQLTVED